MSAIAGAQTPPGPGPVNRQNVGFIETDLVANKSPLICLSKGTTRYTRVKLPQRGE